MSYIARVDRDGIAPPPAGLQPAARLPELPIHGLNGLIKIGVEKLVEKVGVEPTMPKGRLVYSQGISPVKASPGLTVGFEPTTCRLQGGCSAI